MNNLIKRVCSALLSLQLVACVSALPAIAAGRALGEAYELNDVDPQDSIIKPTLSLSNVQGTAASVVSVELSVSGADEKYCNTSIHIKYDSRLKLINRDYEYAEKGPAGKKLSYTQESVGDNGILLTTAADADVGRDGVLWIMDFQIPADAKVGDLYPVSIYYESGDCFTNVDNDAAGKLMEAWVFTNGIEQGSIAVGDAFDTTTTTAKTTTTTTMTTTTTTITTAPITTTEAPEYVKPQISISKVQAAPEGGSVVSVDLSVSGADKEYAMTCFCVKYDERLELVDGEAKIGPAGEELEYGQALFDEPYHEIALCTAGLDNAGRDGVLWTLDFKLPSNVKSGDKFEIEFDFDSMGTNFIGNIEFDDSTYFMSEWAKDHAENGYIELTDEIEVEEPVYTIGDLNGDGEINTADVVLLLALMTNPGRFTEAQRIAADINCDGKVNFADYVLILVYDIMRRFL